MRTCMARMGRIAGIAACVAAGIGSAGASAQDAPSFQIQAQEIVLADGARVANGILVVEEGRITRVSSQDAGIPDSDLPLLEHDGVLTAGLVACQSLNGLGSEANDGTRSLMPEARLVFGFDPGHSDFQKALEAGITTLVLAPNGEDVVGGLTAVVKTHGGTVLSEEGHLGLSFAGTPLGQSAQQAFFFFDAPGDAPGDAVDGEPGAVDGGPENTQAARRGSRPPTSYPGALRLLRESFEGTADSPYTRASRGELPVFIEAHDRHEVLRAAAFVQAFGLSGVVYGAPLVGDPALLGPLRESGLGVIVGPFGIGTLTPALRSVKDLIEAGVPIAFALGAPEDDPQDLRFSAAMALSAGADPAGLWRGLTSEAARLAGAGARVGSLERGKDADFVLWSGDPLNLGSSVEAVYVDGALVYSAPKLQPRPQPQPQPQNGDSSR